MSSDTKLMKDEECDSIDSTKYRGMIGTTHLGLWYPKGTGIETVVYADSDHVGDYVDQKINSSISTFVECCLTSWFSKKQSALSISMTEAEYISARKVERISKKRTKNEAKTTKSDTEWKSMVKTKSRQSPSLKKSTKVNPDKSKSQT
ncbi:hypothetical protein Tco_1354204 [Tanacetum coccineum]